MKILPKPKVILILPGYYYRNDIETSSSLETDHSMTLLCKQQRDTKTIEAATGGVLQKKYS